MFTKLSPSVIRVASRRLRRPMTARFVRFSLVADGLSAAPSARQIADRIAHAATTARRCRFAGTVADVYATARPV
jgi:hypothetical protein